MTTMLQNTNEQSKSFSFDQSFQEKILQSMLIDKQWAAQFTEVFDVDYFHYSYLKLIASTYLNYYNDYKEFPSMELLLTITKEKLKDERDSVLTEQVKSFFKKVKLNENLGDLPFVKEKALDFCRKVALQNALSDCVDLIESEKYEKIVEVVKKAINCGNNHSAGLDLANEVDVRYSETYRETIPTGIPELDQRKILNGGLGTGELGVVVALTGVGKSHVLVNFGAQAMLRGKNVLHYTFELNERAVGIRYDSHILNIDSLECYDRKDDIKEYYQENIKKLGRLRIKYYPTNGATCMTLRGHIEKLATQGFVPDLIIVDYAGIMRSSERYELLRMELKKVCEELRALAAEANVPLWTAIQSNKEASKEDVVDLTNMAEAYGQAHVADFVLGLSRKSFQKATGFGNVFIAKNRSGIDGIKYQIHLDTAKSKLRILTDAEISELKNVDEQEEESQYAFIRQKLRELQLKGTKG